MKLTRRAVIDVGTNSIKLLVADVAGREVRPVLEQSRQTRLGHGFYDSHQLQPEPIARTSAAVAEFAGIAREQGAKRVRVMATSAARDAVNASELTAAIQQAAGLPVQIISGEQEADWAFLGVTTDPELVEQPLLLVECGGGSTQFVLGSGKDILFRRSFALGTVRLLQKLPHSEPPKAAELEGCRRWLSVFLQQAVQPLLSPLLKGRFQVGNGRVQFVGTGGTASILGCIEAQLATFDRAHLEAVRLTPARLSSQVERLWGLPLEERKQTVGLPKNKADVILVGSAIYEAVLKCFEFRELRISTRGVRFGALLAELAPHPKEGPG